MCGFSFIMNALSYSNIFFVQLFSVYKFVSCRLLKFVIFEQKDCCHVILRKRGGARGGAEEVGHQ